MLYMYVQCILYKTTNAIIQTSTDCITQDYAKLQTKPYIQATHTN